MSLPTLRSVLVDGSPRGRIEGTPVAIAISADGRSAVVTHRSWEQGTELVTRVSLDDGRGERLAAGFAQGRLGRRWFASGEGRIVDAEPAPEAFEAWVRESRVVRRREGESVLGLSPDGAWVVLYRADGALISLRAMRFDDGAERVFDVMPTWYAEAIAVSDSCIALITQRNELVQLRFDDGARRSMALLESASSWVLVAERGGSRVVCRGTSQLVVYELDTMRELARFDASPFTRLCHAASGRVLLNEQSEGERRLVVRSLDDGALRPWSATARGTCSALTPDGERVAFVADGALRIADLASRRHVELHDGPDSFTARLAWSPDGALLAGVGRDNTVRVFDVRERSLRWVFEGEAPPAHDWTVSHALFTSDGSALLLASHLGMTLWSLSTGGELARFAWPGAKSAFYDVALSPDGRHLAVAGPSLRGAAGVTVLDLSAAMRVVATWALPGVLEPRQSWLRFEGTDTLRWSIRHAHQRGQVATWRISLRGQWIDRALRGLRGPAMAYPIDGDDRWIVVDRARISVESTKITGRAQGRSLDGLGCVAPFDARLGVAAVSARVAGDWNLSLTLYDYANERVLGVARCARAPLGATLSPDGAHVAVRYADGAFEVFAIDRG